MNFKQSTSLHLTSTSTSTNQDVRDFTSYEYISGNSVNDFNGITKSSTSQPTYANGSAVSFWYSVIIVGFGTQFDNWPNQMVIIY